MAKLTPSQQRNIDRLKEVGPVSYTTRRIYRRPTRYCGVDLISVGPINKANKKGFNITALDNLVKLGLVKIVWEVDRYIGEEDVQRLGNGYERIWTYKLI
jgi:hypothetical protein